MVRTQENNESRKLRKEADVRDEAVNTCGPDTALSALVTQTNNDIHVIHNNQLMEKVVERNNLKKALERVEHNKGAPGIYGMTTQELRAHLNNNWERIKQELLNGTYKPSPVRRVEIPKPDGGVRELGIPTVIDRLIQQAIQQVITPIFEPTFSQHSYGFRPQRSARQAVQQAQRHIYMGKRYVVDIDLEKFLVGWSGYFGLAEVCSVFKKLDEWIRRRLRMCMLKQWKVCERKLRKLVALGIPEKWAGCIAYSRKKYWRLANTPQISKALSLAYWREQGLISLVERYYKLRVTV